MPAFRRLVLLTAGTVALAAGPARAQRPARSDDFLGVTRCDSGQVVTEIRDDVSRSELRAEIEAHEAVHRQQAAAFGGCEAFLASLTTARRIIESELPAYCAVEGRGRAGRRLGGHPAGLRLADFGAIRGHGEPSRHRAAVPGRMRLSLG